MKPKAKLAVIDSTLDKEFLKACVKPNQRHTITDDLIKEIRKLIEDPNYSIEFLEVYKDHLNVYKDSTSLSHPAYLNAVKFFYLTESGHSLIDAYIKTFPERYKERTAKGLNKVDISGEASRFNRTDTVNDIRKVSAIPVQLIHRHTFFEMVEIQAELARTSKSDMVRHKAADTLIRELKPTEDQTINVNVKDGTSSVIEELRLATEKLAIAQLQTAKAGIPLNEIIEAKVVNVDE